MCGAWADSPLLQFKNEANYACTHILSIRCLQGRGGATGYDNAQALPARADSEELSKENNKSVASLKGEAVFSIAKVRSSIEHRKSVDISMFPAPADKQ